MTEAVDQVGREEFEKLRAMFVNRFGEDGTSGSADLVQRRLEEKLSQVQQVIKGLERQLDLTSQEIGAVRESRASVESLEALRTSDSRQDTGLKSLGKQLDEAQRQLDELGRRISPTDTDGSYITSIEAMRSKLHIHEEFIEGSKNTPGVRSTLTKIAQFNLVEIIPDLQTGVQDFRRTVADAAVAEEARAEEVARNEKARTRNFWLIGLVFGSFIGILQAALNGTIGVRVDANERQSLLNSQHIEELQSELFSPPGQTARAEDVSQNAHIERHEQFIERLQMDIRALEARR